MGKIKNSIDWETLENATDEDINLLETAIFFGLPPFDDKEFISNTPVYLQRHIAKQHESDIMALDQQGWE